MLCYLLSSSCYCTLTRPTYSLYFLSQNSDAESDAEEDEEEGEDEEEEEGEDETFSDVDALDDDGEGAFVPISNPHIEHFRAISNFSRHFEHLRARAKHLRGCVFALLRSFCPVLCPVSLHPFFARG